MGFPETNNKDRVKRRVMSLNLRRMSVDHVAQFKAYCTRRGLTMKEVIEALMMETVQRNRNIKEVLIRTKLR